jgi:hypothetical protein
VWAGDQRQSSDGSSILETGGLIVAPHHFAEWNDRQTQRSFPSCTRQADNRHVRYGSLFAVRCSLFAVRCSFSLGNVATLERK